MSDSIVFTGLRARCRIGVTPEERAEPQGVVIDIQLDMDLRAAGQSDDLTDSVDYSAVTHEVVELAENNEVQLLEKLAQLIADRLLADNRLTGVTVVVGKEVPPIPEEVDGVTVKIVRQR